jgi:3D (Asp-Asp-Asp) domain-containing protein
VAVAVVALAIAVSVPAALGAESSPPAGVLRTQEAQLRSAAETARLELYALETQLARARAAASSVAERRREVRARHAATRRQLAIATRAARVSQQRLEQLVRELYAQDVTDPFAVLLDAGSLDELLAGFESLDRAAAESVRIVERAEASQARLARLESRLGARAAELTAVSARAEARARALQQRTTERAAYLAELRSRAQLNELQLAAAEAAARAAQRRTLALQPTVPASAPSPAAAPAPEQSQAPRGPRTMYVDAVAYTLEGNTASGLPVGYGVAAVDPSVIPLGTRFHVPGYGDAVAADTGGAIRGPMIDLWFPTLAEAQAWGRRPVLITIR